MYGHEQMFNMPPKKDVKALPENDDHPETDTSEFRDDNGAQKVWSRSTHQHFAHFKLARRLTDTW